VLLPACLIYDGVGPLLIEWSLPSDDTGFAPLHLWTNLFLSSVFGFLGSYAVAHGLWQLALGRQPTPVEVITAPWREATWAIPMAFLLSFLVATGFFLGFIPAILAQIFLIVAGPVAAIEHTGGIETMKRAWALAEGHRGRAAGLFAVVAMGLVASGLPGMLLEAPGAPPLLLLTAVLQAAVALFGDTTAFLLYGDLRVRKESFDLAGLIRAGESSEPAEPY
jgi:hypothetical protein